MAIPIRLIRRRRQLKGSRTPLPTFFSPLSSQRATTGEQFFASADAWVQTKLTVNQPGDAHEQEADKMAEHVVQRAQMKPDEEKVQRKARHEDDDMVRRKARHEEEKLQKKGMKEEEKPIQKQAAAAGAVPPAAVPVAAQRLSATKGQGSALPAATLREMGQAFGHDFRNVRIHTTSQAEELSQDLRAQAFTNGQDVYFGSGKYNPETTDGKRLLAHELTHVVQQNGQPAEQLQRYPVPGNLACADVTDWLDSNSPYAPEWAETKCTYSFHGQVRVRFQTLPRGNVRATVSGSPKLSISKASPIDSPTWSPTARPNRNAEVAAWAATKSTLLAHEQRHVQIGEQQRAVMQANFRTLNITVTGTDQADAQAQAQQQVSSLQQQWAADAQAAQDVIDPFRGATLACP